MYGGSLEHDCSGLRGIGYYLESLLCLAPFMKHPLRIVLRGVTNDQVDPSVSSEATPHCDFCLLSHLTSEKLVPDKTQFIVECICFVIYLEV